MTPSLNPITKFDQVKHVQSVKLSVKKDTEREIEKVYERKKKAETKIDKGLNEFVCVRVCV